MRHLRGRTTCSDPGTTHVQEARWVWVGRANEALNREGGTFLGRDEARHGSERPAAQG